MLKIRNSVHICHRQEMKDYEMNQNWQLQAAADSEQPGASNQ
jgi:hypothetical protein